MKPGFDRRFSGFYLAGNTFTKPSFGPEGDLARSPVAGDIALSPALAKTLVPPHSSVLFNLRRPSSPNHNKTSFITDFPSPQPSLRER